MALLHCRSCGADIDSEARQTRCKQCGSLFPFACAICERSLRTPFPVYQDERYLTADSKPLCPDHFERQCPECHKWFTASDNPGFFLCLECSAERSKVVREPNWQDAVTPDMGEGAVGEARGWLYYGLGVALCLVLLAVLLQIVAALREAFGF